MSLLTSARINPQKGSDAKRKRMCVECGVAPYATLLSDLLMISMASAGRNARLEHRKNELIMIFETADEFYLLLVFYLLIKAARALY